MTGIKRKAFTLAELLIVLGIIGIIAALTMPALIANHRKSVAVTKLKKVYTVMNQAIKLSEVQNGPIEHWIMDCGSSSSPTCTTEQAKEWFDEYLGKYLQTLKVITDGDYVVVYFNDGSLLHVQRYIYDMAFYLDKKSYDNKKPGINSFSFRLNPTLLNHQNNTAEMERNQYQVGKTFEPYVWSWNGTREGLITQSNGYGCGEAYHSYCTKLIQYEGWKIPDDYPLKF